MSDRIQITAVETTSSVSDNTSKVEVTVKIYSSLSWSNYDCAGSVTIDGTKHSFTHTFGTGSTTIYKKTHEIKHAADGTKSLKISASFTTGTSLGTLTDSLTKTLKTIPRATTPKLDSAEEFFGNNIRISLPAASTKFVHRLSYRFLGQEEIFQKGVSSSYFDWKIPIDLMKKIPNSTAATITVICETYSNGNPIGKKSVTFKAKVPANVVPTANVEISEAVDLVKNTFSEYVQNASKLNVKVTGTGAQGSTIKDYETKVNGITYKTSSFMTGVIKYYGEVRITAKVTDSRGRTATVIKTVTVKRYKQPDLISIATERCNSDGTTNDEGNCIKLMISGTVTNLAGNTKNLTIRYKKITETVYQTKSVVVPDWKFYIEEIIQGTKYDESYNFEVELSDKLNQVAERTQTGNIAISMLAGGKGIRLFGEAYKEGFYVNNTKIPFEIQKISTANKAVIKGSTFTNLVELSVSAGTYAVFGNCSFINSFEAFKTARIMVESGIWEQRVQSIGQLKGAMSVADIVQLDASDTIRLQILHGAKQTQKADGSLKIVKLS